MLSLPRLVHWLHIRLNYGPRCNPKDTDETDDPVPYDGSEFVHYHVWTPKNAARKRPLVKETTRCSGCHCDRCPVCWEWEQFDELK